MCLKSVSALPDPVGVPAAKNHTYKALDFISSILLDKQAGMIKFFHLTSETYSRQVIHIFNVADDQINNRCYKFETVACKGYRQQSKESWPSF